MNSASFFKISAKEGEPLALVAGGAGLVGLALSRRLLRKKTQVICLDDFQTGSRENITGLLGEKNFRLLEHDLNLPIPKIGEVDYIFHLAGLEEYLNGKDVTLETLRVNSLGTQNLLELARQTRAKFLFASSLEVFSLFPLTAKIADGLGEQQKAFSHHEAKRFSESLIAEYLRLYNLDCRIARLVDVYGPGMNLESGTVIAQLVKAANRRQPLAVCGEGMEAIYPTFVEDAVEGIIRATFLSGTAGKIYNLLGPKTTTLKFAQTLVETSNEELGVHYEKGKTEEPKLFLPPDYKKTQKELGWTAETSLEEGLKKTLSFFAGEAREEEIEKKTVAIDTPEEDLVFEEKRTILPRSLFKFILSFLLLGLALLFPFLSIAWDVFWAKENLVPLQTKAFSLSSEAVFKKASLAREDFISARAKLKDITWLLKLLGQEEKQGQWEEKLAMGEKLAAGAQDLARAGQTLEKISQGVFQNSQVNEDDFILGKTHLRSASMWWGEIEAKLTSSSVPAEKSLAQQLSTYRELLKGGENWLEILPQMIAVDSRKTYLLLLQNNMEIRPTGGFIGSFGLLTFEGGKLTDLKIEDVYTADGQLKGHVEPPEPIKKYLGQPHWFLRDSNWEPDFPQVAQKAQWFLAKEMKIETDGVFAFDLNLVKEIIETLGPLEVVDYGETVTSQNLFEITQKHAEEEFFPGSTQKRDFLGALANALRQKIEENQTDRALVLGKVFSQALSEKHLLVYFNNSQAEQQILQNNWGGRVQATPCAGEQSCLGDFLLLVEANLGVNKANYWVKKEIRDKINFGEDGAVSHRLVLDYQNLSPQDAGGGAYKNYLRVYFPKGAVLDELQINGLAAQSAEIATESAGLDKSVLGFYFEVSPASKKQVTILYHLPLKLSEKQTTYELLVQKQAGVQIEPLQLEISYPSSWRGEVGDFSFLTRPEGLQYNSQELNKPRVQYNGDLRFDRNFKISFSK